MSLPLLWCLDRSLETQVATFFSCPVRKADMHKSLMSWLNKIQSLHHGLFYGKRVLEVGSMNINGSPRELFHDCDYIGVDHRPGKGVDVVCLGHEYTDEPFDVVLTTSTLEHDPFWKETLANMVLLTKIGGSMIVCTVSKDYPPHCTDTSPEDQYYENRETSEIIGTITERASFESILFETVNGNEINGLFWCRIS